MEEFLKRRSLIGVEEVLGERRLERRLVCPASTVAPLQAVVDQVVKPKAL